MKVDFKLLNLPKCKNLKSYLVRWSIFPEVEIKQPIKHLEDTLTIDFTKASVYTITATIFNSYRSFDIQTKVKIPNFIYPPHIEGTTELTIEKSKEPYPLILTAKYLYPLLEGEVITEFEWETNYPNFEHLTGNEIEIPINLDKGNYTFWFKCRVKDNIGNVSEWATHIVNINIIDIAGKAIFQFDNFSIDYNSTGLVKDTEIIVVKRNYKKVIPE